MKNQKLAAHLHTIQQKIDSFISTGVECFYEAGLLWKRIRDEKLYRPVAESFEEYIRYIGKYSRSSVYNLINIVQKFGHLIETHNDLSFDHSRLIQALPYVKNKKDAAEWFHRALSLPQEGWQDTLRKVRGQVPSDECPHNQGTTLYEQCNVCKKFFKVK